MTTKEILESFEGKTCVCGKYKQSRMSHCRSCYFKLPPEMRKALYKRFYEGYQEAFNRSLEFLGFAVENSPA